MLASFRPAVKSSFRAFSSTSSQLDVAKMTLIGRIGADPVMRQTATGKDFLIYKVATSDFKPVPKEGEPEREQTSSWHSIFAYGPACERLMRLEKGSLVYVEANFEVANVKTESGEFTTKMIVKHDKLTVLKKPYRAEPEAEDSE